VTAIWLRNDRFDRAFSPQVSSVKHHVSGNADVHARSAENGQSINKVHEL
jgi:hypothetical protein